MMSIDFTCELTEWTIFWNIFNIKQLLFKWIGMGNKVYTVSGSRTNYNIQSKSLLLFIGQAKLFL